MLLLLTSRGNGRLAGQVHLGVPSTSDLPKVAVLTLLKCGRKTGRIWAPRESFTSGVSATGVSPTGHEGNVIYPKSSALGSIIFPTMDVMQPRMCLTGTLFPGAEAKINPGDADSGESGSVNRIGAPTSPSTSHPFRTAQHAVALRWQVSGCLLLNVPPLYAAAHRAHHGSGSES